MSHRVTSVSVVVVGLTLCWTSAVAEVSGAGICALRDGAVRLVIPRLDNGTVRCVAGEDMIQIVEQADGAGPPLLVMVYAIASTDAGPEQLLNEEGDAARRWALATGLRGRPSRPAGEGELTLAGEGERYYRIIGRPPGVEGEREVMVARVRRDTDNLVAMAVYTPGSAAQLRRAVTILEQLRLVP